MTADFLPGARGRFRGALLGLAAGDALGTTLEFRAPGSFEPLTDIVGGGPFNLKPGQWTDDTAMALCLAESLVERQGFDPLDQMQRYVRWMNDGYMSSTGACFDIGNATRAALCRFEMTGDPASGSEHELSAGNGSIMRLAAAPLAFAHDARRAVAFAARSSETTHAAHEAVSAARYLGALLVGAVRGESKETLLSDHFAPSEGMWGQSPLAPGIDRVAGGSFKRRQPPEIRGGGFCVDSLEAALWAFANSDTFEEGALKAVNLGDDADTTGAVYGQLAGAFYGIEDIPERWIAILALRDKIIDLADGIWRLALAQAGISIDISEGGSA